jgi:hypothetical protein
MSLTEVGVRELQRQDGSNCGFYSFKQCQAAVSGDGGLCAQNPFERGRGRVLE